MEKPHLLDSLLPDQLLFLPQHQQPSPHNQDMLAQPSPQPAISSPNSHRDSRRSTAEDRPLRKKQWAEQQAKQQNHGHWSFEENQRYHWFLQIHYQHFVNSHMRRTDKIFKTMQIFVGTRQAQQCRSHHQKMQKKYINFTNILIHFRQENYHTISPLPLQQHLERQQIQFPDGLANQQQLQIYRQMQEQARKKYGRRRMWKRNVPDKQPTPITQVDQVNIDQPERRRVENQPQQHHDRQAEGQEHGEAVNEINMFDEFQHNIGQISVFNQKQDISCLFHSILN